MFNPIKEITSVNGFKLPTSLPGGRAAPKWYEAFETNTPEANREYLLAEWEQCIEKRNRHECGRCKGRGYTRKDGRVGCVQCGGLGTLPEGATGHG